MAPFFTGLAKNLGGYGFGRKAVAASALPSTEYVYTGAQQTTLSVDPTTTSIKFAGVGGGGDSVLAGPGGISAGGGGGGAANLTGYTINPAVPLAGTTLYIGVGGPTDRRNTYVRTTSHSGPIIFEVNQGSNGSVGPGGAGGAANPTYGTTAGGTGGTGGARYNPGTAGTPASNACAGGGGGGGYGDASPFIIGKPAGAGGNVTMSPASYLQPVGHTPWTWGASSNGGAGGSQDPSPPNPQAVGTPAPASGAAGGNGDTDDVYYGTGGGGGAGIILNGVSYGGGGGGEGYIYPVPGTLVGKGAPGFLIVQLLR